MRNVRWKRSILPVVVGERGAVSRWVMPFSRQILSNSTSVSDRPNRPVNTLPLSVNISSGTPWRLQGLDEEPAHRAGGGPRHHPRTHAKPGVVIDPGQHLAFRAVRQQHPTHHVHLPQLHRPAPLPALIGRQLLRAAPRLDQARPCATPDRSPTRDGSGSTPSRASRCAIRAGPQPGRSRRSSSTRASTSARHLQRRSTRPVRPVRQPLQARLPHNGPTTHSTVSRCTPNFSATSVTRSPSRRIATTAS